MQFDPCRAEAAVLLSGVIFAPDIKEDGDEAEEKRREAVIGANGQRSRGGVKQNRWQKSTATVAGS